MRRRHLYRLALGAGVGSLAGESAVAQTAAASSTPAAADVPRPTLTLAGLNNLQVINTPRNYNQVTPPRKYAAGQRRFSIYWSWSYPWEANRDVTELDNRFSTMTEVRRVGWPGYEGPEYSEQAFLQGIAGTLELFHLSTVRFQNLVGQATGQPVAVYQRIDQQGQRLPLNERILSETDTMMVFSLDHMLTDQEASAEEIEAVRNFLSREGTCLILGPHHDVGVSNDMAERQMEYIHHGDPLVPRQQRFSRYGRSLMKGLDVPVVNRWGLHPATVAGTRQLAPLNKFQDLDTVKWLEGVTTFNYHPHLPHYELTSAADPNSIRVLAKEKIDLSRPHPFTQAGNTEFNAFLWMPPAGERAGHILLADLTIFTTLFGGDASLDRFWYNLATRA
jgi:hypothetical protein